MKFEHPKFSVIFVFFTVLALIFLISTAPKKYETKIIFNPIEKIYSSNLNINNQKILVNTINLRVNRILLEYSPSLRGGFLIFGAGDIKDAQNRGASLDISNNLDDILTKNKIAELIKNIEMNDNKFFDDKFHEELKIIENKYINPENGQLSIISYQLKSKSDTKITKNNINLFSTALNQLFFNFLKNQLNNSYMLVTSSINEIYNEKKKKLNFLEQEYIQIQKIILENKLDEKKLSISDSYYSHSIFLKREILNNKVEINELEEFRNFMIQNKNNLIMNDIYSLEFVDKNSSFANSNTLLIYNLQYQIFYSIIVLLFLSTNIFFLILVNVKFKNKK